MDLLKYELFNDLIKLIIDWLQDLRLLFELQSRVSGNLEECSLTICSGYDMVNINYTHIVCPDPQTAKVWQKLSNDFCFFNQIFYRKDWQNGLRQITNNNKANNVCPMTCLRKQYDF